MGLFDTNKAKMFEDISTDELAKKIRAGYDFLLLDVRTDGEFREYHINGSLLIPYDEISTKKDMLPKDQDKEIVVICRSGQRSRVACQSLAELGYRRLKNVSGGILDLRQDLNNIVR